MSNLLLLKKQEEAETDKIISVYFGYGWLSYRGVFF
jgi:hypothetical protein